ncbi:SDR family oxidoreductase [Roseibacillus ishigakijimensis]|uniref:SDR family oxidoreductase n=1 Tax=Roseibacillus ishigakijimensis TaxID=454146 RepID=A0A934VM34_9BACT|nr:SDR family oxidoreductase [Roseibacillus ishigakijimensis]MBK1835324.1 SDR family oxidoreductase [Roseibacillus ishigakijimensis]
MPENESPYSRLAIVTGATSGIGEATVRRFVREGYAVIGGGRRQDKLTALEDELGPSFRGVAGDASEESVVERYFSTAREQFGAEADLIVANAGRGLGGSVKEGDLGQYEEVLKVNVVGATLLMQKAARVLTARQERDYPQRAADIVVIGSVVGRMVSPFSAIYGSTKFAIHAMAEALRREIGPQGVRVTCVAPGIVVSGFQEGAGYSDELVQNFHDKFGPLLGGDDVAETIAHLVALPPHVHLSDVVIRPTRQDYP